MKEISAGMLKVKNSKFYAHIYEISNFNEIDEIIKEHRKMYRKAVHHCWAAKLGNEIKVHDDGEVGHPGRVLSDVLKKYNLDSHVIVVSRIFGGVKLGVGGVARAFRAAGEGAAQFEHSAE